MRFPKMREGAQYRVTVPALNGGVNLKDAPNLVEDNQLTDVKNMWWKDQALRTRPGTASSIELSEKLVNTVTETSETYTTTQYHAGEDLFFDGKYKTVVVNVKHRAEVGSIHGEDCTVKLVGVNGETKTVSGVNVNDFDGDNGRYGQVMLARSSAESDYSLLLFHSHGSIWQRKYSNFTRVTDFYAPTVLINGRGYDGNSDAAQSTSGTLYEGFNLLTGAFLAKYTTDGKANCFRFPFGNLTSNEGETVTITLTQMKNNALKEFTFTIPYNQGYSTGDPVEIVTDDDYGYTVSAYINREKGFFYFLSSGNGAIRFVSPSAFQNNNLVVKAWKTDKDAQNKICAMTFNTWFGGDRSGISGGTRLFVSGNRDYPNLVHWSDINNPLYFPENNYAYIGGADQRITAFGKQADMLVMFKEHELYYATYASRTITAEELQNNAVVDITANMAYFPITQLHAFIGCDCPGSIRLCNNRLVWADSTGSIYALCNASAYSDRNVIEIGEMIRPALSGIDRETMKRSSSTQIGEYYALLAGNTCILMDCKSNEFLYNTSYTNRSGQKIPWYIWDFSACGIEFGKICAYNNQAVLIGAAYGESNEYGVRDTYQIVVKLLGETDTIATVESSLTLSTHPISALCQTKTFDFGKPDRLKSIRRLHIGATDTANGYILLSYITDKGKQTDAYRIGEYGDGAMREWAITPGVNRVRQFGVRAESDGNMAVDNMVLKYEINGEVR